MRECLTKLEEIFLKLTGAIAVANIVLEYLQESSSDPTLMKRQRLYENVHGVMYDRLEDVKDALETVTDELYTITKDIK